MHGPLLEMLILYNKYTFYSHNLSLYDSTYILHNILYYNININNIFKVDIVSHDHKLISLTVSTIIESKVYKIKFYDSYIILNASLSKLIKLFYLPTKKGYFINF